MGGNKAPETTYLPKMGGGDVRFECYRPDEYHVLLHIDCIINLNGNYMQKHMERKMDAKSHMDCVC